jgi:hypothetical protein
LTTDEPKHLEEEKNERFQFAKWIFEVLYSPIKTFEKIAKKPNLKGPILIMLITMPIVLAGQYTSGTKFFLETPTPENDLWTEKPTNSTLFTWSSNGNLTFDHGDSVVGNFSVSTLFSNSSLAWVRLTGIGSFNCSEEEHSRLSFRVKIVSNTNATPTDAKLQLFSLNNESRVFEMNIKDQLVGIADAWANVSVNLATESWTTENSPSWTNVTGIGLQLTWAEPTTLILKTDDLFFGKFYSVISSEALAVQSAYWLLRSVFDFLLKWLILSTIVYLALKSFSGWKGLWKDLVSILGYVYSVSIVYQGALAVAFLLLPPIFLSYNLTYTEYLDIYQSNWGLPISILSLLQYGWATILCTIASKKIVQEISWNKAFLIGFGAVVMSLVFSSFVLSAFF